jgi:hypothetical protein
MANYTPLPLGTYPIKTFNVNNCKIGKFTLFLQEFETNESSNIYLCLFCLNEDFNMFLTKIGGGGFGDKRKKKRKQERLGHLKSTRFT